MNGSVSLSLTGSVSQLQMQAKDLQDKRQSVAALEADKAALEGQVNHLRDERTALQGEVDDITKQRDERLVALGGLKRTMNELDAQIDAAAHKVIAQEPSKSGGNEPAASPGASATQPVPTHAAE